MASMLDKVNSYLLLMLGTIIVVGLIVVFILLYLIKVKKIATTEEHLNYSTFNRVDSTEYAKFKDIVAVGGDGPNALGMIQMNEYTFIGGIDIQGYNFFGASAAERERTMVNAIAFFSVIDTPVQFRQTSKIIELDRNIEEMKACSERIEKTMIDKQAEYDASVSLLDDDKIIDNDEVYAALTSRLDRLQKEIGSLSWQLSEAKRVTQYMNDVSIGSANMKKVTQLFFRYVYNPDDDLETLTKEEIVLKAGHELGLLAQKYGGALEGCGCVWKSLTADDMTDLLRRHYHPQTVDEISLTSLLNSSYSALFVSSEDLRELEKERLGEMIYEQNEREAARLAEEAREEARRRLETAAAMARGRADELFKEVASA